MHPKYLTGFEKLHMEELEKRPFFTTKEAEAAGLSRRMLSYYVKKGVYEKISRGLYRSSQYEETSEDIKWIGLATAASRFNGGVICLISALIYYDITDEFMNEYWIAIPHGHSKIDFPNTRITRMRNIELGVKEIKLAGVKVKIFDVERTIIDSFRLLDFETAMKALKVYMAGSNGRPNIKKLTFYAKELKYDISKYIMPMVI